MGLDRGAWPLALVTVPAGWAVAMGSRSPPLGDGRATNQHRQQQRQDVGEVAEGRRRGRRVAWGEGGYGATSDQSSENMKLGVLFLPYPCGDAYKLLWENCHMLLWWF